MVSTVSSIAIAVALSLALALALAIVIGIYRARDKAPKLWLLFPD
jgi:hypothetical protein